MWLSVSKKATDIAKKFETTLAGAKTVKNNGHVLNAGPPTADAKISKGLWDGLWKGAVPGLPDQATVTLGWKPS